MCRLAPDLEIVAPGPVGMTVNQLMHPVGAHERPHRILVHVHDLRGLHAGRVLAELAVLFRDGDAFWKGLLQKRVDPLRIPNLQAEPLILDIVRTELITVRQKGRRPAEVDRVGISEQGCSGRGGEPASEQKVAISMHKQYRDPAVGNRPHPMDDGREHRLSDGFIPDPVLKKVAQDIKRRGLPRLVLQKFAEQAGNHGPSGR